MPRAARSREPRTRTRIKFFRILFVALGLTFLSGISVLFGMMMAVAPDVKQLSNQQEFKTAQNSVLEDRNGNFLAELTPADGRVIDNSGDIAPVMKQAVVAIEDKRFYHHQGVDLRGLARAFFTDVIEGKPAQGASTIEQQFIKVVANDQSDRSIANKIRETALAYHLAHKWSKDKILTEYLNAIYYGNGAYGIESAARTYFGKDPGMAGCGDRTDPCAKHLTVPEAAFLAGIINSPTAFDPVENPVDSEKRRDLVLQAMRAQGMLNPVQYSDALTTSIPAAEQITPPQLRLSDPGSGYYVNWVRSLLADPDMVGPRTAFEGGLTVKTTLDPQMQSAAEKAIKAWLPDNSGPGSAMVVIDNATGEVRAMVGGQNFDQKPFNLATQGRRQPGSTFKPFVLATALQEGISPNSIWESKKKVFQVSKHEKFTVNNYDNIYTGPRTLANATAFSDNSVFAQVGVKVGTKRIASLAKRMGIRTPVSSNLAMILGGLKVGVTPLDVAHAYETFATGGKRIYGTLAAPHQGPVGIKSYVSKDGKIKLTQNKLRDTRVLPENIANETTNILQGVVKIGSGTAAQIPGQVVWGKTGTTEDFGDAWFAGSTGGLTVAVWVGYPDQTKPMLTEYRGQPVSGGTYPAQIWHTFMVNALAIQSARHEAICADKLKTKNPCAEDTTPTTPTTPSGIDFGGTAGQTAEGGTSDTGTTSGSGASTGATSTGGATATGGTGGGNTKTPVVPAVTAVPPANPNPQSGTAGTAGAGAGGSTGGGSSGGGGVAPGT